MTELTTIEKTEVKPGYKKTPIGMIPDDWEIGKLSDIAQIITGSTPPTKEKKYYGGEYPFVGPGDLNEKYISKSEKYISESGLLVSRCIKPGAILFTCIGSTIGKIGIAGRVLTTNQQINSVVVDEQFNIEYTYYALQNISKEVKRLAGEQAVPLISKSQFAKTEIPLPPLKEQEKIAEILTCWDSSIQATQKLIKQKQQLKKGLMQELLTDKTGEWEERELREISKVVTGSTPSTSDLSNYGGEYLFVSPADIGGEKYITSSGKKLSEQGYLKGRAIKKGSPLFVCIGSTIGKVAIAGKDLVTNQQINALRVNNGLSNEFIYYQLLANSAKFKILAGEQAVPIINKTSFEKFTISVPKSFEEQDYLANILSVLDEEIELLEDKKKQLTTQKQGLMQKLLTGKTRVKLN